MQEAAISESQTVKELSAGWSRERFDGRAMREGHTAMQLSED